MKNLKSNILLSTLFSVTALFATASQANPIEAAYKSSNVKAGLINACKEETGKANKLTAAETTKYCTCAIDTEGKMTTAQKWEVQSAINQKKSPSTLPVIQKQNADLKACFGPQLTAKLQKLSEEAIKESQAKAAAKK